MTPPAGLPAQKFLPLWLLQGVVAYWILTKIAALFIGEPHADEAYYWVWGQHPQLSYFDHAPLHAWLQGLMGLVFGTNLFGLRVLALVTAAITLYVLYVWSRRLVPDNWRGWFWTSAALFYSSPLLLFYTTIAVHDRLLIALTLCTLHCFAWFFADWAEGRRDTLRYLYLGALFLGLATLTKYNGALIGIGVAFAVLVRRDLRSLLVNPHTYVAAALSVALQFPTLYWNFIEGFPSATFHLGRFPSPFDISAVGTSNLVRLIAETAVLVGPFSLVGMAIFLFRRAGDGFAGMLHSASKWVFVASSLFAVGLSLTRFVLFYWNNVAYAAFFGVAAMFMRSRVLQALQLLYGLVIGTLLLVHFAIYPVLHAAGIAEPSVMGMYGWREIAAHVRAAEAAQGADFVAAPSWQIGGRLSFALGGEDVPVIDLARDATDFWTEHASLAGKDAILLDESGGVAASLPYLRTQFDSVEPIEEFTPEHLGMSVQTYRLYIARNYRPN